VSDDLIERLRDGMNPVVDSELRHEAADRIEALQQRVEELSYELKRFREVSAAGRDWEKLWAEQTEAREAAEAREKVLREALEKIANAPAWGAPDRWETTPSEVRQLARAALKGQP
jgi:DNA repair exonuclease SbcCD ATPase subunit